MDETIKVEVIEIKDVELADLRSSYFNTFYTYIDEQRVRVSRFISNGQLTRVQCSSCNYFTRKNCQDCLNMSGVHTGKKWVLDIIEQREYISEQEES